MAERVRDRAQQSNVTPETFLEHFNTLAATKGAIDDANSAHRAAVKAAKSVGLDTAAVLQTLKESKWDKEKRASRFKNLTTYRLWLEAKPGTQWEMPVADEMVAAGLIERVTA